MTDSTRPTWIVSELLLTMRLHLHNEKRMMLRVDCKLSTVAAKKEKHWLLLRMQQSSVLIRSATGPPYGTTLSARQRSIHYQWHRGHQWLPTL
mmetsp:Transcript_42187/g.98975  ORF Transcript_42187/g.98975 Transcript_42187/m.98975 type:complete len:93 (-) Transcript_42187:73-351(-)